MISEEPEDDIPMPTAEEADRELRAMGLDPVEVGYMGLVAKYLGMSARYRWPGQQQARELQALLVQVRRETIEECARACDAIAEGHQAQANRRLMKNNLVDREMANGARQAAVAVRRILPAQLHGEGVDRDHSPQKGNPST